MSCSWGSDGWEGGRAWLGAAVGLRLAAALRLVDDGPALGDGVPTPGAPAWSLGGADGGASATE